ncbi:MAG TPA: ATP-binding cassette domain-containing protein [Candidatus Limnocylindrales bacterium]
MRTVGLSAESEVPVTLRDRIDMLKMLRSAGRGVVVALASLTLLEGLVPAATALAFAALVANAVELGQAATPLLMYLVILLAGHAFGAVREPLYFLAQTRIDGDHRARVARLTASSPTIGALERADVQALIHESRADPESFIEGSPGPGALEQVNLLGRILAMVTSGLVLAAYAWWLIPPLVVSAAIAQRLYALEGRRDRRVWRNSIAPVIRADVWSDAIVSPGEGKDIRVFGLGGWAVDRIHRHVRQGFDPMWTLQRSVLGGAWRPSLLVLAPLAIAYAAVAFDAARGQTSVAVAAAVFAAATTVYQSLAEGPARTVKTVTCLRAFEQLEEKLAGKEESGAVRPVLGDTGKAPLIRFEDIIFGYPQSSRSILHKLELEIRPGELLAIVGLNGAGKSTLIKLLAGLYDPDSGRITADGVDVAAIGVAAWRTRISVVFQDFVRYHLSVADNVALGNAAVPRDDKALEQAARDAGLDALLDRLPSGWDTPLARTRTGGVDLSGGQWQQVVLARALYAIRTGARVLVLDEPTAHLDVRTEFDVFERLAANKGDATVVLISHRLSTVRQADRIVLLSDGRIAESGSHDELTALGGDYARMFAIQADRFRRGYDDRIEEGDLA